MFEQFLIPNWRKAYKFAVMWVQGFGATAMSSWLMLSDEQKLSVLAFVGVPPNVVIAGVALSIFIAGMFARVYSQPELVVQPPTKPGAPIEIE